MARENENQNIFSKAIFSSILVVIALIAIYATPKNFAHLLRFEGKVTAPIRKLADKISK